MRCWSHKISRNYAIEVAGLYPIRKFKDGITFFDLKFNMDLYEGDHNPKFELQFVLLNMDILEINIYNIH